MKRDFMWAPKTTEAEKAIARVASEAGLTVAELRGASRARKVAWPRQRLYAELAALGLSTTQIARKLGGRDHSTVVYGIRAHKARACRKITKQGNDMSDDMKDPETIEHYDNGDKVFLDSYSGGAAPEGEWGKLTLRFEYANGTETRRDYIEVPSKPGLTPARLDLG